jgi:hypothetical protein
LVFFFSFFFSLALRVFYLKFVAALSLFPLDKSSFISYYSCMARGRQTRVLSTEQIMLLAEFKAASHEGAAHGYSLPQLRSAMAASFGWETLKKALAGLPVWDLHYTYIAQWIERYLSPAAVSSGGGQHEPNTKEAGPNGAFRGNR